jgi:K+-sensing histidine kinase KdpD
MAMQAHGDYAASARSRVGRWVSPITVSAALLAATTALLWFIGGPRQDHLVFIYFAPTALIAIRYGSLTAMWMTVACALAAAFLFYPPDFSFAVHSSLDVLELVFFSLLALLASKVVSGFARDEDVIRRRPRSRWRFLAWWWDGRRGAGGRSQKVW